MKLLSAILSLVVCSALCAEQTFRFGSSENDVQAIMGTPSSLNRYESINEIVWHYGSSSVTFKSGRVSTWSDFGGKLKVSIGDKVPSANPITVGSTESDVVAAMGTPSSVARYDSIKEQVWHYGSSSVTFKKNAVSTWSDHGKRLKVSLGEKKKDAKPVSTGSTEKEVIEALGTPTSISRYDTINEQVWHYGLSSLTFKNGAVSEWSNYNNSLNIGGVKPTSNPVVAEQQGLPFVPKSPVVVKPDVAENGDVAGWDNDGDGRTEGVYVRGYYRADGTYVRSHYRASPSTSSSAGTSSGSSSSYGGTTWVNGYTRKDGTYVQGHTRRTK